MCMEKTPWEKAVEFHGHSCPGLAIGFRAAEAALQILGPARDVNEEIVAIAENDSCAVDAIQTVLGCTVGKGNLILRNTGKNVYTIGRRKDGKTIRISFKFAMTAAARPDMPREERLHHILHSDITEIFEIKEVNVNLPQKAAVFTSVKCSQCGEGVMEPKARMREGNIVCPDCFDDYSRGW